MVAKLANLVEHRLLAALGVIEGYASRLAAMQRSEDDSKNADCSERIVRIARDAIKIAKGDS